MPVIIFWTQVASEFVLGSSCCPTSPWGGTDVDDVAAPAAAVELMHTASVVHDDINDHGVVRRGRPSINSIWGRTFALLTGDFLFTAVYQLMSPYGDLNQYLAASRHRIGRGRNVTGKRCKGTKFHA